MNGLSIWGKIRSLLLLSTLLLVGCGDGVLNDPHNGKSANNNIYHSSFSEQPKTLDPARSYSANEAVFTAQIYEPPLQYHYLKRPYQLIPLTTTKMPKVKYLDKRGKELTETADSKDVAYTVYEMEIKPGIYYQPHPAFAKDNSGKYLYHNLTKKDLKHIFTLQDFKKTGTRELTAADYVYQIKRLAHPKTQSPILSLMSKYIVGLDDYTKLLENVYTTLEKTNKQVYLPLNNYNFPGVKVLSRYKYQVTLKGKYPQFQYWLAMPFFSPIPWEADLFYSQAGMADKNINFDWYPVGTGPYMLTKNNPNKEMVLKKNPNFRGETFPSDGDVTDRQQGYLVDAGRKLPMIDEFHLSLEKESIPRWNKFLQGFYDASTISSDNFDQAIKIDAKGKPFLTPDMKGKNLKLQTSTMPAIFYLGFNMHDSIVGGYTEKARKLRQALAIAINYEEFISIFLNGRGVPAQGPIPPGIFGSQEGKQGINPYMYNWKNNKAERKPLEEAKKLLAEAGFPDGRDKKTGKPLVLNLDVPMTGGPDDKARYDWFRKQFAKLGIQLNVRATLYNRFQEKLRVGNAQIFFFGWSADYPDPENFLFLLYGPNSKVKYQGENSANYQNKKYDRLFELMKDMPNGPERQLVINKMLSIVYNDTPFVWGFVPKSFTLTHEWVRASKPHPIANNTLKYTRIDPQLRAKQQKQWNQPILWPLLAFVGIVIIIAIPIIILYRHKEYRVKPRITAVPRRN